MDSTESKQLIPPDYTDAVENIGPSEDDDDDIADEDEGRLETFLDNHQSELKEEKQPMQTSPFGTQPTNNWGTQGSSGSSSPFSSGTSWSTPWSKGTSTQQQGGWASVGSQQGSTTNSWNTSGFGSNQSQQNIEINRDKKVVFCNFLDCIVETWSSNGIPGFLPRGIYDLKPRFDVWQKLQAINPEKIYAIVPVNLIPITNGANGWEQTLGYYCCCVSEFLRQPYLNCQVILQTQIGQPKSSIIGSIINDPIYPIPKNDVVFLGIYSGQAGQSNEDYLAAKQLDIDYIDLNTLLHNMI